MCAQVPPGILGYASFTALGLAVQLGRVAAIKALCDHGVDPNTENRDGQTALMMALEVLPSDTYN
jgi:ankyrin repeat protein